MATMNVSLPDLMKAWVEAQVDGGQYGNASDYVRDLIRRDQKERDQIKTLQAAITKGIESGISDRSMQEILKEARSKAKAAKDAKAFTAESALRRSSGQAPNAEKAKSAKKVKRADVAELR